MCMQLHDLLSAHIHAGLGCSRLMDAWLWHHMCLSFTAAPELLLDASDQSAFAMVGLTCLMVPAEAGAHRSHSA